MKLKEAGQSAGTMVEEVAKDAKGNLADVAERFGSLVKSRWSLLQQPSTRHAVQERLVSAAATTGTLLRKGVSETKDKVVIGKTKVEEVNLAEKSYFLNLVCVRILNKRLNSLLHVSVTIWEKRLFAGILISNTNSKVISYFN